MSQQVGPDSILGAPRDHGSARPVVDRLLEEARERLSVRSGGGPLCSTTPTAMPGQAAGDDREQEQPSRSHRPVGLRRDRRERRERCDHSHALGRVVQGEADDERGAEGELAHRQGRPDREPLAEVVHADPDGDEERDPSRARCVRDEPLCAGEQEERERCPEDEEHAAAERGRAGCPDLEALDACVDGKEREQSHGESHQDA